MAVLAEQLLGHTLQLLLLARNGFLDPALVVARVCQLLDALFDAFGVGLDFFVGRVLDFTAQRFAAPVALGLSMCRRIRP